jgi:hypothetical protein
MKRTHPDLPWCRYADDGLVHCRTQQEAEGLKAELQARLEECRLQMHPTKTKIVYCRDGKRKGRYPKPTVSHHWRMLLTANAAVSWSTPTLTQPELAARS